ncbi:hypothetical protein D3C75_775290 [compost metagenome]
MTIHAVVLIKPARVLQRFNDAGNRDFIDRVNAALYRSLHRRQHRRPARRVAAVSKVIRQPKTAARGADLAEHRRQRDQHPVLLLAKLLTLHAPSGHQHRVIFVEQDCQFANFSRLNATDVGSPLGRFGDPVRLTGQVVSKEGVPAGTAREEILVLPAIFNQRMGNAEHQRDVGAHMRGDPFGAVAEEIHGFRAHRVDADQTLAAFAQRIKIPNALLVAGVPRNLERIERIGAPQYHHVAVLQHQRPAGLLLVYLIATDHIRHDGLCRTGGVIPQMAGVTARQAHIALKQRRRLVQHAV